MHVPLGTSDVSTVCKMAFMEKLKCTPFVIIQILDIGTILRKINHKENEVFEIENMLIFALNFSANKSINYPYGS